MTWIKEEKLYLYIVLLLILIMAIRMPLDTDMWWHLRAGQETWENKQVYSVDTFSFTRQGESWINHSWFSQVLMYLMFQGGGFYSLSIWVGICAVASMVFVYMQMEGHPLLRSGILILTGTVSSVVWSPRPQVMSLVLFSLLSYLLHLYKRKGNIRVLIVIVPLFMVWGNLHGGYILGILLMGCFIGGSILNQLILEDKTDQLSWKQIGLVSIFMVISLLAVLVNPFGFDMWRIPFNTIGVETLQNLVSEWSSPDFHQAFQQPMLFMLLAVICAVGLSKRQIDLFDLVALVFFSWAALTARRNFGPFAIVAAPILAKHSKIFFDNWYSQNKDKVPILKKLSQTAKTSNQDFNPMIRNLINSSILLLLLSVAV